jgi:hypothetical protein
VCAFSKQKFAAKTLYFLIFLVVSVDSLILQRSVDVASSLKELYEDKDGYVDRYTCCELKVFLIVHNDSYPC